MTQKQSWENAWPYPLPTGITRFMVHALVERPIYQAICKQYQKMAERGWDKMYWAIDLHETLIKPSYKADRAMDAELYPYVPELLSELMSYPENHVILWSSLKIEGPTGMIAHKKSLFSMEKWVRVHYNENPLEKNTEYADFSSKFYFNVLLDDKAGFDPKVDINAVRLAIHHCRPVYKLQVEKQ
jgi:hypothetical protein